eukprot:NODE_1711_length_1632_cov_43.522200_g1631_i0.p1 GENE.NODE_1711_length_1632_cov_43.522200_g1631_i0~~NODE_1711_length_1632_cov_43.522200_g1631_i0.p1  ORF type:complete len:278 (+),score=10.41 NODE_1711_length_1632_cov_43.522200_g1631_i0:300-1133(+)
MEGRKNPVNVKKWKTIPCQLKHTACCKLEALCPSNSRTSRIEDRYATHGTRVLHGVARKYSGYALWNCAIDRDNWQLFNKEDHRAIASNILKRIGATPGDFILDWGAGCGTKVRFHERSGPTSAGFGIDISEVSVWFANRFPKTRSCFCHGDGARIDWLPSATFDHVISFGAVYHLFNSSAYEPPADPVEFDPTLCNTVSELLRVVKPGGFVLLDGHMHWPPTDYYRTCNERVLEPKHGATGLEIIPDPVLHPTVPTHYYWRRSKGLVYAVILRRPP